MSHLTQNKSFQRHSQPFSWRSTEKLNLTQLKQTCIRHKIYYNTKQTRKTKARFGRLIQPPEWNGPILKEVNK